MRDGGNLTNGAHNVSRAHEGKRVRGRENERHDSINALMALLENVMMKVDEKCRRE